MSHGPAEAGHYISAAKAGHYIGTAKAGHYISTAEAGHDVCEKSGTSYDGKYP